MNCFKYKFCVFEILNFLIFSKTQIYKKYKIAKKYKNTKLVKIKKEKLPLVVIFIFFILTNFVFLNCF